MKTHKKKKSDGLLPGPITSAIKPVAEVAQAFNGLRQYLLATKGVSGVVVQATPIGLVIEFKPTAAPGGRGGGSGTVASLPVYIFTSCVNGSPMSFDIPIQRGPY